MTDSAPKALKCPNCTERFSGENRQALLKAHVSADFAEVGQAVRSMSDTRFGRCQTAAGYWG